MLRIAEMYYDKLRLTENHCHIFLRKLRVHTFQVEYAENDSDLLGPLRFFSALLRFTEFNRAGSLSPSKVQLGRTLEFCGQKIFQKQDLFKTKSFNLSVFDLYAFSL